MRIWYVRAKRSEFDLLVASSCASHNCWKESGVANFPQLQCQINSWVRGKPVSFGVKCKTCNIFGVTLQNLPLGRGPYVIDAYWSIMGANGQTLGVVMECNHREHFDHVWKNDGDVFVRIFSQGQLVGIKASKEDLNNLNQMFLKIFSISIHKVS